MKVSFDSIGELGATFYNDGAVKNSPVKMSEAATVTLAANGNEFCGVCYSAGEDFAGVTIRGAVTLPFSGTAPAVGYTALVSDGTGVKSGGTTKYLVLDVSGDTVTFML